MLLCSESPLICETHTSDHSDYTFTLFVGVIVLKAKVKVILCRRLNNVMAEYLNADTNALQLLAVRDKSEGWLGFECIN